MAKPDRLWLNGEKDCDYGARRRFLVALREEALPRTMNAVDARAWAREHHIEADWVVRAIESGALRGWDGIEEYSRTWSAFRPVPGTESIEVPYWSPFFETETEFLARLKRDYLDKINEAAAAAGLKQAPEERGADHFRWFVWFQVLGKSKSWIATHACGKGVERTSVREALAKVSERLSIPLRDGG